MYQMVGWGGITLITFSDFAGCPNQQVTDIMEVVVGRRLLTIVYMSYKLRIGLYTRASDVLYHNGSINFNIPINAFMVFYINYSDILI